MNKVVPLRGFGGGTSLNFNVIKNPKPINPDENTVWINTDVDIPLWTFAAVNPYIGYHDVDLIASQTIAAGVINSNGTVSSPDATNPERYTEGYIPVEHGKTYDFFYTVSESKSMWLAVAEYTQGDDGYPFIKRTVLISNASGTEQSGTYTPSSTKVKAVRLCWRTFQNTETSVQFLEKAVPYTVAGTENGTVFIKTGATGSVEFNALKKNGIAVYPVAASQYVDGVWMDKPAQIYQKGGWVDWTFFLFRAGSGLAAGYTGFTNAVCDDDLITMTIKTSENTAYSTINEKVDVTNYKTAFFEIQKASFSGASGYSQRAYIHVGDMRVQIGTGISGSSGTFISDGIIEVDVSALSGKVDVQASAYSSDVDTVTFKILIKNIYFQ